MPNIETYEAKAPAPRADSAGSEAFELEGRHIESAYAEAGQAIGRGIGEVGQVVQEHEDIVDTTNVANATAKARVAAEQASQDFFDKADPNDPDGHAKFVAAMEPFRQTIAASQGTTVKGHDAANRAGNDFDMENTDKFLTWSHAAAAEDIMSKADGVANLAANRANADPSSFVYDKANVYTAVAALPEATRNKVLPELLGKVADGAVLSMASAVEKDPNRTPEQIDAVQSLIDKNPDYQQYGTSSVLDSVRNRLNAAKGVANDTAAKIADQTSKNILDQVKLTGILPANYSSMAPVGKTPEERAVWQAAHDRDGQEAVAEGQINTRVQYMSPEERATTSATINKAISTETDPDKLASMQAAATKFDAVNAKLDKDRKDDAAGSAMGIGADGTQQLGRGSPTVFNAWQALQKNPTPQNISTYMTLQQAYQGKVSPDQQVQYLPKQYTDQIASQIAQINNGPSQEPGKTAQQYVNILDPIAKQWGAAAPQIMFQLRASGAVPGRLGIGAELLGDPKTHALAQTIFQTNGMKSEDLEQRHGISRDKALNGPLGVIAAFQPVLNTLTNVPGGNQNAADYMDALGAAVQYNGTQNAGPALVAQTFNHRFTVANTVRIPPSQDARRMTDGMSAVMSDLGNHKLVLPEYYPPGITPSNYANTIANSGKWYTTLNGKGVELRDADNNPVWETKNGKQVHVELDWDELGKAADRTMGRSAFRAIAGAVGKLVGTNAGTQ